MFDWHIIYSCTVIHFWTANITSKWHVYNPGSIRLPCELRPEIQKPLALSKPKLHSWVTHYTQHLGKWRRCKSDKNVAEIYKTWKFINLFTRPPLVPHVSQRNPVHALANILTLSSHLHLSSGLFGIFLKSPVTSSCLIYYAPSIHNIYQDKMQ